MIRHLTVLFFILLTNFSFSQVRTVTMSQTQNDAIKGIDRKAWNGLNNISLNSYGYANDFTLPVKINPCEKITNVNVKIQITSYSNTISCPISQTYFNVFYGCTPYAGGATCLKAKLILEPFYLPTTPGATFDFTSVDFGGNLSVDIIPVSNPCYPVLNGWLTYEYTTTVTVTITDPLKLEIIDPAPVCSGGTVDITSSAVTTGSTTGTTLTYWTDAAATIGLLNPSAITTSGTYYIKSTLNSCSITKPVVVTIFSSGGVPTPVVSPVSYCKDSGNKTLTATPAPTATLNWYGVDPTGGTASTIPTLASTASLGQTTYYVSQTIGTCESPRVAIVVNVVADTGAKADTLRCDPSQATVANSVFIDWSHVAGRSTNDYGYSYSIDGGFLVFGRTPLSGIEIFGVLPGKDVTFTILDVPGVPCYVPQTIITTKTVVFNAISTSICSGDSPPSLPLISDNGVSGTWFPAIINNTTSASYLFTPDPLLFPCALSKTISVTVNPNVTPTFSTSDIQCEGTGILTLPSNSSNVPQISGSWSPATVDTSILGSNIYEFTPDVGSCVISPTFQKTIEVYTSATPTFDPIPDFCSGTPSPSFPLSNEGITGAWFPISISNATGTKNYQFTPDTSLFPCAPIPPPLIVNVIQSVTPTFSSGVPTDVCEGATLPDLPLESTDTLPITGIWTPSETIDTSLVGTLSYTFIPDAGQCAIPPTAIDITVNPSSTLTDVSYTVTDAFENNQIITVVATATGNYLYQLDSGPLQTSPIFENVSAGIHTITVSDVNGCSDSITENDILVIKHPKFFTPNGDGYNDTWNIPGLKDQLNSRIHIFDRYGKLLKDISPNDPGWDGTYIGQLMPADDYWFNVEYIENAILKKFKSHFSLKR